MFDIFTCRGTGLDNHIDRPLTIVESPQPRGNGTKRGKTLYTQLYFGPSQGFLGQFAIERSTLSYTSAIFDTLGNLLYLVSEIMATITMDPFLTEPDTIVLKNLLDDVKKSSTAGGVASTDKSSDPARHPEEEISEQDEADISRLKAFNDPSHPDFTPTVPCFQRNEHSNLKIIH
jgi:hypothetical protein